MLNIQPPTPPPSGPEVPEAVRRHRLFVDLDEAALTYLMGIARIGDYGKHHTLFAQGAPCDGMYIVLSGTVRLFKAAPDGREHVVEVIRKGQSFAEAAVFADVDFPVHAETLGPSRLMFLPKSPYLAFFEEHPRYLMAMIAGLSIRMHQLVVKVERLTLKDALQRAAGFLLDMADDNGHLQLDVTKATLASQLGLTPETLSRALSALQELALIHMDSARFRVLDKDRLQQLHRGET